MNLSPVLLNPAWLCSVNSNYLNGISRFAFINKIIINNQVNIDWSFSFGNLIRSFLKLNVLFISISGQIVNHFKRVFTVAIHTLNWFINSSSFKWSQFALLTARSGTPKENLLWLRNDLRTSDKNPFKTNQSVNLLRRQMSHLMGLLKVNDSDPDNLIKIDSFLSIKNILYENLIHNLIQ